MNKFLIIYLKGILMGICDLIPGISGGTIAFITGIYERLIRAIYNITLKNKFLLLKDLNSFKKFKNRFIKFDFDFLTILFAGILTSIFLGSKIIHYLLENYLIYLLTFFIGLIVASSKIIYEKIENHSIQNFLFGILGFIIGIIFLLISPKVISEPSFFHIILGGFLAITAMFLPGISGSFILLILGLYEYIINALITYDLKTIFFFLIGAIGGILIISRIITYLFNKDRCKTLYVLLGLVLGSISIPIYRILENVEIFNFILIIKLLFLFVFGIGIVYLIQKLK